MVILAHPLPENEGPLPVEQGPGPWGPEGALQGYRPTLQGPLHCPGEGGDQGHAG